MSNAARSLLRGLLGRRLPAVDGEIAVGGVAGPVAIRRDRWGIPHIEAANDADAWFGLGFCHGQDRAFQLETLLRVIRGTLSELVSVDGVEIDRLSRRIGFNRGAAAQFEAMGPQVRRQCEAYVAGVNSGNTAGLPRKAHEFALLMGKPTPWAPSDIVGIARLQSFLFATNADAELARLKIVLADGPGSLAALDPIYGESWQGVLRSEAVAPAVDRLSEDLARFGSIVGGGGASNSWSLSGSRTASGRPILANDPHLPALLPSVWYLAHVKTPQWGVAGATLVGAPAVEVGHNGFAAWGVTAALFDNTDLFREELGADGESVRLGDEFVPCEVHTEKIKVRGRRPITERVVVTPRGPVVSPALDPNMEALSLGAFWLRDRPIDGFLSVHNATGFDDFRRCFAQWPGPDLNVTYADEAGTVAWQLVGEVPVRKRGWGTIPLPGWDPGAGWEDEPVPFDQMPFAVDPERGFVATANTRPYPEVQLPFLGVDWIDGYRLARISEELAARSDWDTRSTQELQLDEVSIPWRDMRETVLALDIAGGDGAVAHRLLGEWDGRVSADSPAAAVFEFFVAEMARRVVAAKAPNSSEWALGQGFARLMPYTSFSFRRVGHLVELMNEAPGDWFGRSWAEEMADALAAVERKLAELKGRETAAWAWGKVRPIELVHPVGERKPMDKVFNIGPITWGGDSNTVAQTSVDPIDATGNPAFIASLRMVADVGNWDECSWILPAGQSGNPLSPHYDDQLPLWRSGSGVAIPWSEAAVAKATVATLTLLPKD